MLSDQDLALSSKVILTGTVESVFSAWDDDGSTIWTYVEVRPQEVLKGTFFSDTVVLKQPGGVVGLAGVRFFGQPTFNSGDEVLLYLNTGPDKSLHVAHCFMGMFSVVTDPASGERSVQRWDDSTEATRLQRGGIQFEVTDQAPFDQYVSKIRDLLERNAASTGDVEGPDFLAVPDEYYRKQQDSSRYYSPAFNLLAGGVRWMQADSGQAVAYSLNPSLAPVGGGGSAEIQRAMTAWPSQSGANVRLQLGAQTTKCGFTNDGVNTISFGDCRNQLDPPVNCSGVLAQTTVSFSYETKVVGGRTFKRLLDADVVFNKGMECFLSTSANLAECACHELGHAIGLDHSGDAASIMWPVLRGGGRDATLADDDRSGVLAIYPAAGGGGGAGVSITSASLPHGLVGNPYQKQLAATGGSQPYNWRLIGGQLPSGLSLSSGGVINGIPSQPGTYYATIQVRDSVSASDSKALSLTVDPTSSVPVIQRVKVKGTRKLMIYGQNFRSDSRLILNGVQLTPKSVRLDGAFDKLVYKGDLHLRPSGSNVAQVVSSGQTSAPVQF
jgi:hypothetical protein